MGNPTHSTAWWPLSAGCCNQDIISELQNRGGGRGGQGGAQGGRGGTGGGGETPLVKQGQKVAISCDLCGWNYTPQINLYQLHLEYVSTKQRLIFIFYYKMWALNIFILLRKCDKKRIFVFRENKFFGENVFVSSLAVPRLLPFYGQ